RPHLCLPGVIVPVSLFVFFSLLRGPPTSSLFPYTTLFRSFPCSITWSLVTAATSHSWKRDWDSRSDMATTAPTFDRNDALDVLPDRKSTRLNSSHVKISYAVFCLKKKNNRLHCNVTVYTAT